MSALVVIALVLACVAMMCAVETRRYARAAARDRRILELERDNGIVPPVWRPELSGGDVRARLRRRL